MDEISSSLLNYYRYGDRKYFEKVYLFYMPKMLNFFYFRTFDKHISEDLASEVFIKVFLNTRKNLFNNKSFNSWIFKTATNQLIDYLRKIKKETENIFIMDWQDEIDFENYNLWDSNYLVRNSIFLKKELAFENKNLADSLENLTNLQKNVILMMFVMDFDYKMISDVLGKSQSTVRGIVFRAINAIKNELNNDKRGDKTKC